jgi:hypothetical protein
VTGGQECLTKTNEPSPAQTELKAANNTSDREIDKGKQRKRRVELVKKGRGNSTRRTRAPSRRTQARKKEKEERKLTCECTTSMLAIE